MTVYKLKLHTNIVNQNNLERKLFYSLTAILILLFASYIYFLGSITFNIVERKALDVDIRNLSSNIGELELEYLSLSNKIDLNLAGTLGFKEIKNPQFVSRESMARNLSFKNNGI